MCAPEFFIIPKAEIERAVDCTKKVRKYFINDGDKSPEKFRDAGYLIAKHLAIDTKTIVRRDPVIV